MKSSWMNRILALLIALMLLMGSIATSEEAPIAENIEEQFEEIEEVDLFDADVYEGDVTAKSIESEPASIPEESVPVDVVEEAEFTKAAGDIPIDSAHFPDPVFREYVKTGLWDSAVYNGVSNHDSILSRSELECVDMIIQRSNDLVTVDRLDGIEYFFALESLDLSTLGSTVTSIPLKSNPNMRDLDCEFCDNLKQVDISGCPKLIECYTNGSRTVNGNYVTYSNNSSKMVLPLSAKVIGADRSSSTPAVSGVSTKVIDHEKDNGTITLNVGDKIQLDSQFATYSGAWVTGYKSSKVKVASVDDSGLVTAQAEGKAKISITTDNKKLKAKLTIHVVDPWKPTGISLTQGKSIILSLGETLQLNANLEPSTARTVLTWKSSKTKVATVDDNGLVTPLSEGKAKITVNTANKKKAKITVQVVDPWKPSGVTLAQGKDILLTMGETLQLDANLEPSTARTVLTWKSSKTKVATVDGDGLVTPVSEGKAKITVTTSNKKKAKITVQVVDPWKANRVNLAEGKQLTMVTGEIHTLNAILEPSTARTTLTWTSSKPAVASVDGDGTVTAHAKGKATITVKTANGKKAKCKIKVEEGTAPVTPVVNSNDLEPYIGISAPSFFEQFGFYENSVGWEDDSALIEGEWGFDYYKWGLETGDSFYISIIGAKYNVSGCYVGLNYNQSITHGLNARGWKSVSPTEPRYDSKYYRYSYHFTNTIRDFVCYLSVYCDDSGIVKRMELSGEYTGTTIMPNNPDEPTAQPTITPAPADPTVQPPITPVPADPTVQPTITPTPVASLTLSGGNDQSWLDYTAASSSKKYTVTSNTTWKTSSDVSWLKTAISGSTLTVTTSANTGSKAAERTGIVTITSGDKTAKITVVQTCIVSKLTVSASPALSTNAASPTKITAQNLTFKVSGFDNSSKYLYRALLKKQSDGSYKYLGTQLWDKKYGSFTMSPNGDYGQYNTAGTYMVKVYEKTVLENKYGQWDYQLPDSRCVCFYFTVDNAPTVTTPPSDSKLSAPAGFKVDAITDTTVSLSFNSVNGASGYYVYYSKSSAFSASSSKVTVPASNNIAYITGLSKGTKYYFWIAAYDSSGTIGNVSSSVSEYTGVVSFTVRKGSKYAAIVQSKDIIEWPVDEPFPAYSTQINGNGKFLVKAFVMSSQPAFNSNDSNKIVSNAGPNGNGYFYGRNGNQEFTQSNMNPLPFSLNGCTAGQYVKIWIAAEDNNYATNKYVFQVQFALKLTGGAQNIVRTGKFSNSSLSITAGSTQTIQISGSVTNSKLAAVTVNGSRPDGSSLGQVYTNSSWNNASSFNKSITIDARSTGLFSQTGTYKLKLWVRDTNTSSLGGNDYVATMNVTVTAGPTPVSTSTITGKFNQRTHTMTIGETWIADATVNVSSGYVGKVTITTQGYSNGAMSDDFSAHNTSTAETKYYAAYMIDTSKAPFNTPDTYTLKLYAKDKNGNGGQLLDQMTLEIRDKSNPSVEAQHPTGYPNTYRYKGGTSNDIVNVAKTQIGYKSNGSKQKYGFDLYGQSGYEDWCAYFVAWCARQAGVNENVISNSGLANPGKMCVNAKEIALFYSAKYINDSLGGKNLPSDRLTWLSNSNVKYYTQENRLSRSDYIPRKGDLVYFHKAAKTYPFAHVGIVTEIHDDYIYFIDGNNNGNGAPVDGTRSDLLKQTVYERSAKYTDNSACIIGFARPNY